MSLLLLLKPKTAGTVVTPPTVETLPAPGPGSKQIPPPRRERFLAGTARIFLSANKPDLLFVTTARGATVRLRGVPPDWEQQLAIMANAPPNISYRAVKDERVDDDFHDAVLAAFLLTR